MDKPTNWGILSCARIAASALIPAIRAAEGNTLGAVASRSKEKAEAFAREHGIPSAYGSYEELIADETIDAIYIPLPNSLHFEWAKKCAEAGKPVLCEKPLATSTEQAKALVKIFADAGVLLAEGFMYRFHPMTETVKQLIDSGKLGTVRTIRACFTTDLDNNTDIRLQREFGGGAMFDLGCYCVNIMRHFTGQEPCKVKALGHIGAETDVDEQVVGTLEFPGGVLGQFNCGFRAQFTCAYEVVGSKGWARVSEGAMVAWPGGCFTIDTMIDGQNKAIEIEPANHYQRMVEDFSKALTTGQSVRFPAADAISNLAVIEEVLAQLRS